MLELSLLRIYPSILQLQGSKTKEVVDSTMLTSLLSHDKSHQNYFVAQLMDQIMYHYSGSV